MPWRTVSQLLLIHDVQCSEIECIDGYNFAPFISNSSNATSSTDNEAGEEQMMTIQMHHVPTCDQIFEPAEILAQLTPSQTHSAKLQTNDILDVPMSTV